MRLDFSTVDFSNPDHIDARLRRGIASLEPDGMSGAEALPFHTGYLTIRDVEEHNVAAFAAERA